MSRIAIIRCPRVTVSCGSRRGTAFFCLLSLLCTWGLTGLVVLVSVLSSPGCASAPPKTKQEQRADLIRDLIQEGVIRQPRQTAPDIVHVPVTPLFMATDFDNKQAFASMIYAYYFGEVPKGDSMVVLDDARTNKKVGIFAPAFGLHLN